MGKCEALLVVVDFATWIIQARWTESPEMAFFSGQILVAEIERS
jgi:hypothetical protein